MMKHTIYLDYAATTPPDPLVLEAMIPCYSEIYGNPSSLHIFGMRARERMENARKTLASCLNARPDEIIFTSGGTESNNLAIKGIAEAYREKGNHIIVSAIEHECLLNTCRYLESRGFYVTYLSADNRGMVDPDQLSRAICSKTILVSVMHANNEIGTIQPIEEIGKICRSEKVLFHTDACQSFGKIPLDFQKQNIDLVSINAHKIYGPKGVGALVMRKGIKISPQLHGGGQEQGIRSSTENVPGITGFAKAAELAAGEMEKEGKRLNTMRRKLVETLEQQHPTLYFNGHPIHHLPNHLNFSIRGLEGEAMRLLLLLNEQGIAVSAGSACSSNDKSHHASHVLQAIGRNPFEARGAIRVSFGRFTTEAHLTAFAGILNESVPQLTNIFSG
ncbi:MAG: cysteine desulfurase family protein [Bacteroidetes bacterium]|nr:cysteine desulfurase family protein [Bacteroidota bacterium]